MRKYQRKAAGKVFLFVYAAMKNLNHQLSFNHLEWGDNDFLTERERLMMNKLKARLHTDAELCRQFGQRLCR